MKKSEAPFAWRFRITQPYCTFWHVCATDEKAKVVSAV